MNIIEKYNDQIDQLIQGKLKGNELSEFETVLNQSDELMNELNYRKSLLAGLGELENQDIKSRLKNISKGIQNSAQTTSSDQAKKGINKLLLLIPIIALLLAMYYFMSKGTAAIVEDKNYYAAYFEPYPLDVTDRGATDETIQTIQAAYKKADYDNFLISSNLPEFLSDPQWLLYRGVALVETGNLDSSRRSLQKVIDSKNAYWTDHGTWYLALSFLKSENIEKAIPLLESLTEKTSADHHAQAIQLLKELK